MEKCIIAIALVLMAYKLQAQDKTYNFTTENLAYWQNEFGSISTNVFNTIPSSNPLTSEGIILLNKTGYATSISLQSKPSIFHRWNGTINVFDKPYNSRWCGGLELYLKRASNNTIIDQDSYYTWGSGYKTLSLSDVECDDPQGCYIYVRISQGYGTANSPINRLKSIVVTNYWPSPWAISGSDISFSQGKVGIGIGTPVDKLHISGGDLRVDGSISNSGNFSTIGSVSIGTTTPDAKLTVKGDIHAEAVTVDLSVPGPDYVFEEDYNLTTLEETETYIKTNKHLPEIPPAKEMEAGGIDLGEMNMLLLKKIEELTLHVISLKKENEIQHRNIEELRSYVKKLY